MRSLLEDFWYGNIIPHEQSYQCTDEIQKLLSLIDKNREKLCEVIADEDKVLLEKYDDCVSEMHSIINQELFIYAFRLGGRLMLETLAE